MAPFSMDATFPLPVMPVLLFVLALGMYVCYGSGKEAAYLSIIKELQQEPSENNERNNTKSLKESSPTLTRNQNHASDSNDNSKSEYNNQNNGMTSRPSFLYRIEEEVTKKKSSEITRRGTLWSKHASWYLPSAIRDHNIIKALNSNHSTMSQGLEHVEELLKKYDVDPNTGFLPKNDPLQRLPCARYHLWEDLGDDLPKLLGARLGQARDPIKQLPILATDKLITDAELRRAHLLLCLFAHAYVWGGPQPIDEIPEGIAVPLWEVSNKLGMPPVLGHPSIVLYNWRRLDLEGEICMENLSTLNNFFDGRDESWFYLITVEVEARGAASIIPVMLSIDAIQRYREESEVRVRSLSGRRIISNKQSDESTAGDAHGDERRELLAIDQDYDHTLSYESALVGELTEGRVAKYVMVQLKKIALSIQGMCDSLNSMREGCHPFIFYHRVRPFLSGWKHNPTLAKGVLYRGVSDERQQFYGGSAAQSSMLPFLDISLGVDHSNIKSQEFLLSMRAYMPCLHREFLTYIESVACIRTFVVDVTSDITDDEKPWAQALKLSYDECIAKLSTFRTTHIALVAEYIMSQQTGKSHKSADNLESSAGGKGTGGTDLMNFLKPIRDNCRQAALESEDDSSPSNSSQNTTNDDAVNNAESYLKDEGAFDDIDFYRGAVNTQGKLSHYQLPKDETWGQYFASTNNNVSPRA